jgi:hypothetical protein
MLKILEVSLEELSLEMRTMTREREEQRGHRA